VKVCPSHRGVTLMISWLNTTAHPIIASDQMTIKMSLLPHAMKDIDGHIQEKLSSMLMR